MSKSGSTSFDERGPSQPETVLIFGASHPVARRVCLALAKAGSRVIALGRDEDALFALASEVPERIESLCLPDAPETREAELRAALHGHPVAALLLAPDVGQDEATQRAEAARRLTRFAPVLQVGRARAVILLDGDEGQGIRDETEAEWSVAEIVLRPGEDPAPVSERVLARLRPRE